MYSSGYRTQFSKTSFSRGGGSGGGGIGSSLNKPRNKVKFNTSTHQKFNRNKFVSKQTANEINMSLQPIKVAPITNYSLNLKARLRLNVAGKRFEVCFILMFNF